MPTVSRALRAVMRASERLGIEDQVKQLRALTNAGLRRDLREHTAMRLLVAVALRHDGHGIDVGAHQGSVLGEMARLAPDGRHLGFEPIPELRMALEERFAASTNVEILGTALSDAAGEATFHHVVTAPGYSGLRRRDMPAGEEVREIAVTTARLDDVLPEGFRPALIKIDVEGAELLVLRGAADTVARHKPMVIFEHGVGGFERYGAPPGELHDLLVSACGLRIFDLAGEGPYSRARFEDVFTEPIWNFVAR